MNSARYYQASGSAPVAGLMITLVIGMIGGVALSTIYSAIVFYNPMIKLNVLAGGIFAAACGGLSLFGVTLGKVRNRMFAALAGGAIGFLSLYFAWVAFLYFFSLKFGGQGVIVLDLNHMLAIIQEIGKVGWWSMNEGGGNFSGWGLYLLWALEAVTFIGLSAYVATLRDRPFCEECNQWCEEQECPVVFSMPEDIEALQASLEADDYSPLYQSVKVSPHANVFLKVTLYPCPECEDTCWLKLQQVVASLDDKGEIQTKEQTLINYLDIAREDYSHLMSLVLESNDMGANPEGDSAASEDKPV